jgi:hypothetical protein
MIYLRTLLRWTSRSPFLIFADDRTFATER